MTLSEYQIIAWTQNSNVFQSCVLSGNGFSHQFFVCPYGVSPYIYRGSTKGATSMLISGGFFFLLSSSLLYPKIPAAFVFPKSNISLPNLVRLLCSAWNGYPCSVLQKVHSGRKPANHRTYLIGFSFRDQAVWCFFLSNVWKHFAQFPFFFFFGIRKRINAITG